MVVAAAEEEEEKGEEEGEFPRDEETGNENRFALSPLFPLLAFSCAQNV